MLMRRFFFCVLAVLAHESPYLQVIGGLLVAAWSMILQWAARPFNNDSIDLLDCFSMLVVFFYLCCGLWTCGLAVYTQFGMQSGSTAVSLYRPHAVTVQSPLSPCVQSLFGESTVVIRPVDS